MSRKLRIRVVNLLLFLNWLTCVVRVRRLVILVKVRVKNSVKRFLGCPLLLRSVVLVQGRRRLNVLRNVLVVVLCLVVVRVRVCVRVRCLNLRFEMGKECLL